MAVLSMSKQEFSRLEVLLRVQSGRLRVSDACVLIGLARLPQSRLDAYRWFERGVLISVFFTQVILFRQDQLAAVGGLLWDLALLTVLRFLLHQEEARV